MTSHAKAAAHPHVADVLEPLGWAVAELAEHVLGVLATVVVLLITAGGFIGFLSLGWFLAAFLLGSIGLLAIAIGFINWLLGKESEKANRDDVKS